MRRYLHEDNIELVWEKGGSGLCFYTDDCYWGASKPHVVVT